MRSILLFIILLTFWGCNSKIAAEDELSGSKLIEFKRVAIMDTITAIIKGEVVDLNRGSAIGNIKVELSNEDHRYNSESDGEGKFAFNHIAAGTYQLKINSANYNNQLQSDTIHLGPGDKSELKIGLMKK